VKNRQLVVNPPPQKTNPQDHWGRDPGQCLFKIRAVLFRDMMTALFWDRRQRVFRYGVKIPDKRRKIDLLCNRKGRTAVCRDTDRCGS